MEEFEDDEFVSSPVKFAPARKRRRSSLENNCMFHCDGRGPCDGEGQVSVAEEAGIQSIVRAAKRHKDAVLSYLHSKYEDIDNLHKQEVTIQYHRKCYKRYTVTSSAKSLDYEEHQKPETIPPVTRSQHTTDWRACIECGFLKHQGSTLLHTITIPKRATDFKTAAIALDRQDILMRIGDDDLVRKKAKYHAKCMKQFLKKYQAYLQHIQQKQEDTTCTDSVPMENLYDLAFQQLISEIEDDIFHEGKMLRMLQITQRFNSILKTMESSYDGSFAAHNLKIKLTDFYGKKITIERLTGHGRPNVILSSDISVGDVASLAQQFKDELRTQEVEQSTSVQDARDPNSILRQAAALIMNEVNSLDKSKTTYPSPSEIGHDSKVVPPLLRQFMSYMLDTKSFECVSEEYHPSTDKARQIDALSECILQNAGVITPICLGLAVQMHHDYASRTLLEILHAYGFSISYDETRRFETSVGKDELERMRNSIYKPTCILSIQDGRSMIHEGDDNVDCNTQTIDGKNTFHSMARVIFQMTSTTDSPTRQARVLRQQDYSLKVTNQHKEMTKLLPFDKPPKRPEPPRVDQAMEKISESKGNVNRSKDIGLVLMRMVCREVDVMAGFMQPSADNKQTIPFWTAFNHKGSPKSTNFTKVGYAPILDHKPSDMATVYTTMKQCKDMSAELGQGFSVQTMDQQLYAIAQQVKWHLPVELRTSVLILGGIHETMCFISSIGKIFASAGLRDLLVDADVYSASTAEMMLEGKQFHRAVRGLTLAYEVLMQEFITQFITWCGNNDNPLSQDFWQNLFLAYETFGSDHCNAHLSDLFDSIDSLEPMLEQFKEWGISKSPTFALWVTFLDMVQLLLINIRASRECDWNMHMSVQASILPYIFATNKVNYSRYVPIYILDMLNLPDDVRNSFQEGLLSYREKPGSFNGLWTDMGVEKTVIRDAKGDSGVLGLTRKPAAMLRWTLTRHQTGEYSSAIKTHCGLVSNAETEHAGSNKGAMTRDEKDSKAMHSHLLSNMTNPYQVEGHPDALVNILTGIHASPEIQRSMLGVASKGQKMLENFVQNTLDANGQKSFYSPITQNKLLTFKDMTQKVKIGIGKGLTKLVHISGEIVFKRALSLSEYREDVNIDLVVSHVIGPVPSAMFNEFGLMRKPSNKADLATKLEAEIVGKKKLKLTDLPAFPKENTVYIRDSMAIIQAMMPGLISTFNSVANDFAGGIMKLFDLADTVIDVFDQYSNELSVKALERARRESTADCAKIYQVIGGRIIPPWSKFLGNSANKIALNAFLAEKLEELMAEKLTQPDRCYIMAGPYKDGTVVKIVTNGNVNLVPYVMSTQEEADTRMVLHMKHVNDVYKRANVQGRIIVRCHDTDVMLLCVYYFPQLSNIKEMWMEAGYIKKNYRLIPVHDICEALPRAFTDALPAIHAITGCDTTSNLMYIGKNTVYQLTKDDTELCNAIHDAITGYNVDEIIEVGQKLVAKLYDKTGRFNTTSLNVIRSKLSRGKPKEICRLPPCEDAFAQHMKRVAWQAKLWYKADVAMPQYGSPMDFGWQMKEGILQPVYFTGLSATELLDSLVCSCKDGCASSCSCKDTHMPCIEPCACGGDCANPFQGDENED